MHLFPLGNSISIVEGTPMLFLEKYGALVLGDMHLGQESQIIGSDLKSVSPLTKELKSSILAVIDKYSIEQVIINGDIKHLSKGYTVQEKREFEFLLKPISEQVKLVLVKGNHDRFIKLVLNRSIDVELVDFIEFGEIFIFHGDRKLIPPKCSEVTILSHEHPSYILTGSVGERVKLPAFARIISEGGQFLVLPATSPLSSGVSFPPSQFLSPILKDLTRPFQIDLFPFDKEVGILPIPRLLVE